MTFLILRPGLLVQGLAIAPVLIINLTHFGWRVFDQAETEIPLHEGKFQISQHLSCIEI